MSKITEIKSVNPKGNQPWILIGRTDAEVEGPVFWSSDVNSGLIAKVPDAGKDCEWKEKRASEDEMAGWHHQCNGHELGQTSGDGEGQGGLACCDPWGLKQLDTTGQLNNNGNSTLTYWETSKLFSTVTVLFYTSPHSFQHLLFSTWWGGNVGRT